MSLATITLSFANPRCIYGEGCSVDANIENLSGVPLLFSSGTPVSPLTYSLRTEGEQDPRYVLSERAMMESLARGILKESPPEKAVYLQPGAKRRIEADLTELGQEPFLPGKYSVTASMPGDAGSIVSRPAALEIVPTVLEVLARSVSMPREKASVVFVHREANGVRAIYHQLSKPGSLMHSVYYRVAQAGAEINSIATSTEAVDIQGGRRLAWIEGSLLRSLEIWDNQITKPLSTCPEELPGCVVVNPGIQFADGSAVFLLAREAPSDTALLLYRIRGSQWTREASGVLGAAAVGEPRLEVEAGGQTLRILWAAGNRVFSRRFTLGLQPVDQSPLAIVDGHGPLVAWNGDAAITGSPETGLTAHLGPRPVKLPVVPPGFTAAAIAHKADQSLVVIQCRGLLLISRPGQSEWKEAARGLGTISRLNVFSIDGRRYWAQWVEPGSGVHFALLPKN